MTQIKLGIIGLSEGNGHPYSWSAIFNGFDPEHMIQCPFPSIPDYLSRQRFPDDAIGGARVTHIWTQDREKSEHIAKAARIERVVDNPRDMLGEIDGLLVARDDAKNHLRHAAEFMGAGIPVYVDKPLALDEKTAQKLIALQTWPGQLYTCSALRYAREFQLDDQDRQKLGRLLFVQGIVPKDWDRYAVHILDPAISLFPSPPKVLQSTAWRVGGLTTLNVSWENGVRGSFTAVGAGGGAAPIALRLVGADATLDRIFVDSFAAFKTALQQFIKVIQTRQPVHNIEIDLAVVRLIEAGRR